jgi:hypothetical protein
VPRREERFVTTGATKPSRGEPIYDPRNVRPAAAVGRSRARLSKPLRLLGKGALVGPHARINFLELPTPGDRSGAAVATKSRQGCVCPASRF